jgi:hypothetical protein
VMDVLGRLCSSDVLSGRTEHISDTRHSVISRSEGRRMEMTLHDRMYKHGGTFPLLLQVGTRVQVSDRVAEPRWRMLLRKEQQAGSGCKRKVQG